ncbi:MAG: hypothetical protein EP346_14455 [Bacteroidetes bacterium]|nr:MAG: hypothetical protein EP346_14455 [Bacteroidota bacterium]
MKKILRFFFILILLLLAAVFLLPIIFKDQIFDMVKEESNNHIKGEVVIEDMSLSLFSDFPNLTLGLDGLDVIGEGDFADMSLVKAGNISVEIDLFSAISGTQLEIESIVISDADLYVLILPDGTANYDIARESTDSTAVEEESGEASAAYSLSLKEFRLDHVNLVYDDRQGDMYAKIDDLNHRLSGDFSEDVVDMTTRTTIESLDVAMGSASYLRQTKVEANVNMNFVTESGLLTLEDNSVVLNGLTLNAEGSVKMGDQMDLDLKFNAPSTSFAEVLSLIPEIFYRDFEDVQTSGTFALNGFVKGTLDESDVLPALGLNLSVANASFKYPDLPAGAEKLNVEVHISKPVGTADATVIDIPKMSGLLANQPVDARLHLEHPISDPEIDMYVLADLDLVKVEQMVPQEDLTYRGRVVTDLAVKGKMSDFEKQNLSAVEVGGNVALSKFSATTSSFGLPVEIDTVSMAWEPELVRIPVMSGKMGKSDFNGSGTLDNIMSYVLTDTTLRGRFRVNSTLLDLNELAAAAPASDAPVADSASSEPMEVVRIPTNIDMDIRAEVAEILYDDMVLHETRGQLTVVEGVASLIGFKMETLGGEIAMDGTYDSRPLQPEVLFGMNLKELNVAEAASTISMLKTYAPILEKATGNLSTSFDMNAFLGSDMTPDLSTVSASGILKTIGLKVEPDVMQKIASKLNNDEYGRILLGNSNISFQVENGRLSVQPFDVKIGGQSATISGSNGLDQSLNYTIDTKLPINSIKVPQEVAALGITGDIDVQLEIGGSVTSPTISTNFGSITQGIQNQVQQIIQSSIDSAKGAAIDRVNEEAEKIMAAAREQAQKVKDEAKRQADRIRSEARNTAQQIKDEAKRQGDKLIEEAGGNPLKKAAAETAARRLNSEAETRANQLIQEADARAKKLEDEAQQRADRIIAEAEARAKIDN